MGRFFARCSFVVAVLVGGRAHADAPRVDVTWSGPEQCPRERFVDGLARHLVDSDAAPVGVAAVVREDGGAWRLVATLSKDAEAYAPRTFAGRSCDAVVDAAALAVAIAIDPLHVADGPAVALPEPVDVAPVVVEPAPPVVVVAHDAAPPPVVHDTETRALPPRRRPAGIVRGFVSAAGAIDGGALPGVGLGVAGSLGLIRRRLRVELVVGWRAPVKVHALADDRVGARVDLVQIGVRTCGVVRPARRIELPLCAGLDSGFVRGRGFGLAPDGTARLVWLAAVAAVGVSWSASDRVALFTRTELGVPLRLHELAIAGLATIDRVAPVYGRALFGVEVRFP